MKKRIGNDIQFTWHIYRKSGETQTPESFDGKDVEVKLISPLRQPVTIEDVTIATGVVTFTFRGKHQVTLGNYVAVLQENRGEDGMVTLDVVSAVTLVAHSYMEEDGDDGDVIEAESVELTSTISAGGGGGFVQQQADWAQTDDTAVDYIKNKPDVVSVGEDGVTINKQFLCLLREAEGKIQRVVLNVPEQGNAYVGVLDNLEDTNIQIYPHGIFFEKGGIYGGYLKTDPTNHPGRLLLDTKVLAYIDDLASLVDGGDYNSQSKEIELKHGDTVLARIDARAFVKDGMVDSVVIENGYIVITFNTDAGKQDISLALTDIFNPANYYDKTAMDALLAGKQDTITDLPAIRSGAAAGATAVQPADLDPIEERLDNVEEALTESLPIESFVMDDYSIGTASIEGVNISSVADVPINQCRKPYGYPSNSITIDNTTYYKALRKLSGDEVVAEFEFEAKGNLLVYYGLYGAGSHYDYFLSFYFTSEDGTITNKSLGSISVFDVEEKAGKLILFIPKKGVLTIKATEDRDDGWIYPYTYYANIVRIDFTATPLIAVYDLKSDIQAIEQKIPAQASSSNQLADKDFVNSSVATATATYRGSYNLVSDLLLSVSATQQQIAAALATKMEALSITPDNNDYCFVQIPTADATPTEIARIDRYKYDGTAWAYEYSLNNSSFTAAQWAALNSGITSGLVTKLGDLPTATELAAALAGKASTQELAGKQDKMPIVQVASGTTAINAAVNTYYEVAGEVGTLAITLPTPTDLTKVSMVVVHLTAGTTPNVVIGAVDNPQPDFAAAYDISAGKEYEINCMYNGDKWIVADMEVV